ncbi:TIGR02186 family protein [Paenirhodobacter populi]|uniref:TIGR02186 family protein n=1 Tax=Paenirhodobacter populi TaxID=2306993 RepID=A0A443JPV5_9RHOB|nr:TIGR02186 family protein [Sinirhodobacter populi]RWR12735.1 hypothetical protein D2T33_08470 [Sinirhodobacter populi]RWR22548.1 hypothetical protein D2T30_06280 [Sinirhodobacter populi]RWR29998.1 hypothetical protein D2T31_08870 [Sinirhodobacter populi]
MRGLALILALICAALPARAAMEEIVAGLSHDNIGITAAFNGSEVLIYGAVKRDAPEDTALPLAVIVTLEGPAQRVTIRQKSREYGIWINSSKVRVSGVPSYYSVATSGPLESVLSLKSDVTHRISVPLSMRAFEGPIEVEDARPYTAAMMRLREENGTFSVHEGAVHLVEDTLFRADFSLPANLVEGDYKTRIFLLRGGEVIDTKSVAIYVRRVGLERWLYMLAREHAPIYGVMALAIAVLAGWGASTLFRLIRN